MGAPYSGGEVRGPAFSDVAEKVDWVEKFVRLGTKATEAARSEHDLCAPSPLPVTMRVLFMAEPTNHALLLRSRPQIQAKRHYSSARDPSRIKYVSSQMGCDVVQGIKMFPESSRAALDPFRSFKGV